jgi:hypothetical protein
MFLGSSSRRRHPLVVRCHRTLVGSYVLNRLTEWRWFLDYQVLGRETKRRPKGSIAVAFYDPLDEETRRDEE